MAVIFKQRKTKINRSIESMDLSYNNKYIVTGQQSPKDDVPCITIWEIDGNNIKFNKGICLEENEMVFNVKFCNNDNHLVYYKTPKEIKIYDLVKEVHIEPSFKVKHFGQIETSKTNGNVLISSETIKVWNIDKKEYIWKYDQDVNIDSYYPTTIGGISIDGKYVAICGNKSKEVILYDIEESIELKRFKDGPEQGSRVYFFSNYLVCIGYRGEGIYIWDLDTNNEIFPYLKQDGAFSIQLILNKNVLLLGGYSGYMTSLNFINESLVFSGGVHKAKVVDMKLLNDGNTVITSSEDGTISFIDIEKSIQSENDKSEEIEKQSPKSSIYNDYAYYFTKLYSLPIELVYDYDFMIKRDKKRQKEKLPPIPADHTIIHDFIRNNKTMAFEDNEVEVDLGYVELSDNGYEYFFEQGGMKKEVFFPELKMDQFVVAYFFSIFGGSQYEKSNPEFDNMLYKDIRRNPFNPKAFTGYLSFKKHDFNRKVLNRIVTDFGQNNDNAVLYFFNKEEKEIFLSFDPKELEANRYGVVEDLKYIVECDSKMSYYDCIKLDAYMNIVFNRTHNMERYKIFKQYYLSRENIFIPEDIE
jgi:hypothetical protein